MTPTRIGRYDVVRLIGRGGMGEVFEGYDPQLQRKVAIKGLLHDRVSVGRRERLRREALSSAALSHPAVVHVYEILTEGDADWVVMEYVSGSSLAEILAAGPLPVAEIARIGREIALALAEAHRQGIIHRDIKTENVMLTSAGHVKVLDFGLAMWTGPRGSESDRLTTDGLVVGTSRAMSPEQALGREIDARSDVFSLGSTLYELATGKPAFSAGTVLETMHKVAKVDCVPLAKAAPQLPDELCQIIERCMARNPASRYGTAEELAADLQRFASSVTHATAPRAPVRSSLILAHARRYWWPAAAALLVLAALAAAAVKLGWISMARPLAVAVLPVSSPTSGNVSRLASSAIEDAMISRLAQLDNVIVVSGRDVRAVASEGKRVPEIARELGVRELVEASVDASGPDAPATVILERLDGATGHVAWSEQLEVGTGDLLVLQDRIGTTLSDAYRGIPTSGNPASQGATPDALAAFLEVKGRLEAGRLSRDYADEIAMLEKAIAEAPRFFAPLPQLAGLYRNLGYTYRRPEDFSRAEALLKRADELSPGHPWVRLGKLLLAIDRGDNQAALDLAQRWTAARPGDAYAWNALAQALGRVGRFADAEAAFSRSLALLPSGYTLSRLAREREDRGDFDGARRAIHDALALSPTNQEFLAVLAEIEMYAGNSPEAERLYRDLLARRAQPVDRIHLGNCLYYQNRFGEAAAEYREAWEKDRTDYLALANLADTQLAMGDKVVAGGNYGEALRLCEVDYARGLRRRALLETRARCLAQLGHGPEAFLAIEEALKDYPDNPATLFMAALVAAVAGDDNACLAWTSKAITAHAPRMWFSGPEFARVAHDARFASLLGAR